MKLYDTIYNELFEFGLIINQMHNLNYKTYIKSYFTYYTNSQSFIKCIKYFLRYLRFFLCIYFKL